MENPDQGCLARLRETDVCLVSASLRADIDGRDSLDGYGKALIAFIVSKHTIFEELIGLFGPVFVSDYLIIVLVINDANPSADAGQCPHIKRYIISGKSFQNPDVQSCCRPTTAERNCSLH